ncbi:MAG: hypothetical protein FWF96_08010 [Kiritimatiellaeota bacterium]|nr:hypothetical protein [Kiritimatiellota bacterium]
MGSGRTLNKKPRTRPVKSEGERRRRQATQARRLVALGVPEETVESLQPGHIRSMLLRPARAKSAVAKIAKS